MSQPLLFPGFIAGDAFFQGVEARLAENLQQCRPKVRGLQDPFHRRLFKGERRIPDQLARFFFRQRAQGNLLSKNIKKWRGFFGLEEKFLRAFLRGNDKTKIAFGLVGGQRAQPPPKFLVEGFNLQRYLDFVEQNDGRMDDLFAEQVYEERQVAIWCGWKLQAVENVAEKAFLGVGAGILKIDKCPVIFGGIWKPGAILVGAQMVVIGARDLSNVMQ